MPTERQDGIELRNSVDNSAADAGFRDLERAADATSRRIAESQAKAAERAARAEEAAARARDASAKRALSVGAGMATAAAGALGGALRSAGAQEAGAALEGAASGAARLGTMLAPLGPQAMAAGAAVGALGGAVTALAGSSEEAARRARDAAQAVRDASAAEESARSGPRTLEARVAEQRGAHERIDAALHAASRGATVSREDVLFALDWDKDAALSLLDAYERTAGKGDGSLRDMIDAGLDYTLPGGRSRMQEAAAAERYRAEGGWTAGLNASGVPNFLPEWMGGESTEARDRLAAAEALGARRLGVLGGRGGWDPEIERLIARQDGLAARERRAKDREFRNRLSGRAPEEAAGPSDGGEGAAGAGAPQGRLLSAGTDSLGAKGIGHAGNPMRETETLLREIRDDARRAARRPGGAYLA